MTRIAFISMLLCLSACGGGSGSVFAETCSRIDECNALAGTSVDECISSLEKAVSIATEAQRHDVEKGLSNCLEFATCQSFVGCL
jgi:hypothetical protein